MKKICSCVIFIFALSLIACSNQSSNKLQTEQSLPSELDTEFGTETGTETELEAPIESEMMIESETETDEESSVVATEEPTDEELVRILDYIPDIIIDLKYATTDNFTGQVIYESDEAYLRYGTVKKLMQVQEAAKIQGYLLVIWDAYRPVEAQFALWEICPDSTYVANPNKGYSKHSRGNTVDISLTTLDGQAVEMPSGFDDFTKLADRNYSDVSQEAGNHSTLLEKMMEEAGFKGYSKEWWHYSDTTDYSVIE